MRRYEISEPQWTRIAPLLPHRTHHGQAGHPFNDLRPIVNGILWILHTGAPWRDLPERYGPWETVFRCFNRWRADGTWGRIVTSLLDELVTKAGSTTTSGASTAPSSARAGLLPGRKKNRPFPTGWAGESRRKPRSRLIMR